MIVRAIRNTKIMLLIFTDNANNSDEIKKEIGLASRNKLTVIPVRIEDVLPNDALDFELATRQWIDFFGDWERALDTLCKRASQILKLDLGELQRSCSLAVKRQRTAEELSRSRSAGKAANDADGARRSCSASPLVA